MSLKLFLESVPPPRLKMRDFYRLARTVHVCRKIVVCVKCGKKLRPSQATLDHIIPDLIIRASFGKYKQSISNFQILCGPCNNHDPVLANLGAVFSSRDIKSIRKASSFLCDLVRNNEKQDSEFS